ncbi:MAG: hypothetical protein NC218_02470 [Acetobacter sp.]|nr:hypothetical protein [Acetobacter sp.]
MKQTKTTELGAIECISLRTGGVLLEHDRVETELITVKEQSIPQYFFLVKISSFSGRYSDYFGMWSPYTKVSNADVALHIYYMGGVILRLRDLAIVRCMRPEDDELGCYINGSYVGQAIIEWARPVPYGYTVI